MAKRNTFSEDEIYDEKFDINQVKRLFHYVKPYRTQIALIAILMLSSSGLSMLIPTFFMKVMDDCIPMGMAGMKPILGYVAAILLITVYGMISLKLKIRYMSRIGQNIVHEIRSDIFNHLQELPFSYYDERPHGKIQVRVVNYVNNLSDLLSNGIINTITDLCNLFFIVGFMIAINGKLTLLCMCGLPVLVFVVVLIKRKQHKSWQIQSNKQSNLNAYIAESINGVRVTQSFVREEENIDIFNGLSRSYRKAWMRAVRYNFLMSPMVDIISNITTAFIYVLGIQWMFQPDSGITVGVLVAFTAYISRFWNPINTLASFYNSLLTAISYLERIFETIDEPVDVKDREDAVPMPPIRGEVEFQDVTFSYEPGVEILQHVNLKAEPGKCIAIVGPTGAGKSTIVNLISRFYDVDSGKVLIDGIDISGVTLKSLRSQMGIMMQDSFIFSGTIMDNIRYGNQDATDEEVIAAAKAARADHFIKTLPGGYQMELNEDASNVSQGQKQLLTIARAILADNKILILDEATSSVDTRTEIEIQKAMDNLMKGRTSFVIAHRLSTIRDADLILVMKDGDIIEQGRHEELLAAGGFYANLYNSQFEDVVA